MNSIKRINIDFTTPEKVVISVMQFDTDSRTCIFVPHNSKLRYTFPEGTTVRYAITKPDGHRVYNNAEGIQEDGTVKVTFSEQCFVVSGTAEGNLIFYHGETVLSSFPIEFEIGQNNVEGAEIVSTDEFQALTEALAEVDNLDITASKVGDTATVTVTRKDGEEEEVEIKDGEDGEDYVLTAEDRQDISRMAAALVSKSSIGLGNVDNTSDANKPISNAAQAAFDEITDVIPDEASSSNKLADKAFVNSSVQTATSFFKGNWETWASVPTTANGYPANPDGIKTPTANDYLVVRDASGLRTPMSARNYSFIDIAGYSLDVSVNGKTVTFLGEISGSGWDEGGFGYTRISGIMKFESGRNYTFVSNKSSPTLDNIRLELVEYKTGLHIAYEGETFQVPSRMFAFVIVEQVRASMVMGSTDITINDYGTNLFLFNTYEGTWRLKYNGLWSTDGKNGWQPEYQVNETPLTAVQLAALNSGITKSLVEKISQHETAIGQKVSSSNVSHETWTFTLTDNTTVNKEVMLWQS